MWKFPVPANLVNSKCIHKWCETVHTCMRAWESKGYVCLSKGLLEDWNRAIIWRVCEVTCFRDGYNSGKFQSCRESVSSQRHLCHTRYYRPYPGGVASRLTTIICNFIWHFLQSKWLKSQVWKLMTLQLICKKSHQTFALRYWILWWVAKSFHSL